MIQQYPFATLLALSALTLGFVFLALCKRGVIPDPIAKHALAIAAGVATLGVLPLLRTWLSSKRKDRPNRPVVVVTRSPTDTEITAVDDKAAAAKERSTKTRELLRTIDKAASDSLSDVDAGSLAIDRLRGLQG
jgi:hypothetical protein